MKSAGWQGRGSGGLCCLAAGRQQHAVHSRFGRSAQHKTRSQAVAQAWGHAVNSSCNGVADVQPTSKHVRSCCAAPC